MKTNEPNTCLLGHRTPIYSFCSEWWFWWIRPGFLLFSVSVSCRSFCIHSHVYLIHTQVVKPKMIFYPGPCPPGYGLKKNKLGDIPFCPIGNITIFSSILCLTSEIAVAERVTDTKLNPFTCRCIFQSEINRLRSWLCWLGITYFN